LIFDISLFVWNPYPLCAMWPGVTQLFRGGEKRTSLSKRWGFWFNIC